jgi:hypothetical protein
MAGGSVQGGPRVRDVWGAYVAGGKRYGSTHTVVVRLPDGNFRITQDTRLLLDVLGINKEDVTAHAEYVVTPEYKPVSIVVDGKRASGAIHVAGTSRGSSFAVEARVAGIERSRVLDRAETILPEPCLDDWLADRPPGFKEGALTLLREGDTEPEKVTVTRITNGSGNVNTTWSIRPSPDGAEQRLELDASGMRLESSEAGGLLVERRCSASEARDISYRTLDGRDALMFPLGKDVGAPERLEAVTVELRWKDIPPERFRLEDERQHVVEQFRNGSDFRAVLRIQAPKPIPTAARLPIAGAEFAPYLGESRYIKPRDERIAAVAREVTKGESDALKVARALADWVSRHVEIAYLAETLSGPEVLACRKGKCSEFATLFASLARSAGLPTRIVLGERMLQGQWGGHMWNEVYAGRWITVDAGYNEVGASAALVKLTDHETVDGVQALRVALPASFGIEIRDFRARPSPLAAKFRTGIAGRVYTNADYGCRMTAPADGWTIEEVKQPGAAVMRFKVPGNEDAQIHFVAFGLPVPLAPKALLDIRRAYYNANLKGFEVIADTARPVEGLTGHALEFRHETTKGKPRRGLDVVWRKEKSGFLLALSVEEPMFDQVKAKYLALLASFEDLEKP